MITFGEPEDIYQTDLGIFLHLFSNKGNINFTTRKETYEGNQGSKLYNLVLTT